jgi:diaminohydroxyphosphoribosylaminopyrimidine deaminase/5-amino-6-(5-phosphoribosylamino)uracil reductase
MSDERFMKRALELAALGTRRTLPNPSVGAVIVKDNVIIGEGYHQCFGHAHAEANAIASVRDRTALHGSTIYVTLEPCAHHGKTPPCADLLINSGIARVVVGCLDPFEKVSGSGIAKLQAAGLKVDLDLLRNECIILNKRFILARRLHRPYIILKWAQTADHFIAPENSARLAISSPDSQKLLHYWRGQEMAIAVGSNTARIDDPLLSVRYTDLYREHELPPTQPVRIVIGDASRLPSNLNLWRNDAATIVYASSKNDLPNIGPHVTVNLCNFSDNFIEQVCKDLYQREILSIIIEGGTTTINHFLDLDLWDEIRVFTAPIEIRTGKPAPDLRALEPKEITKVGPDLLSIYWHRELRLMLGMG